MDSVSLGSLLYLVLLLVAVGGWAAVAHRGALGAMARNGAAWVLIFLGVVVAYGIFSELQRDTPRQAVFTEEGRVEVPRSFDGHYYLTLRLDGTPVRFVVDTGATDIVLTREDAERVGIDTDRLVYTGRAGTANGMVRTARARVDELALGAITDRNVPVWITTGEMSTSLLGMAYLGRFDRLSIEDNRLVLER